MESPFLEMFKSKTDLHLSGKVLKLSPARGRMINWIMPVWSLESLQQPLNAINIPHSVG